MLKRMINDFKDSDYRKDQMKATLWFVLGVAVFAVIAGFLFRQSPYSPPAGRMGIVSDFPDGTWFNTTGPLSLFGELRGHVVVVLFNDFTTLADLEDLTRLCSIDSTFTDQPVMCVVVCAGRDTEDTGSLIEQWQIHFPVIADPDFTVMDNFGVRALPSVLIIDTASRSAARYYQGWTLIPLEDVISDLLEQGFETRSLAPHRYIQFPGDSRNDFTE